MRPLRFFTLFLFFQHYLSAQEFSYRNISTELGLPGSQVFDILQDKRGYMWFATDHGVARYNGKEFKSYTTSDGLLDNTVLRMCEDSKGRIWFVSQSNELCYWQNDSICTTPASEAFRSKTNSLNVVSKIYLDSLDNIWISGRANIFFSDAKQHYREFTELVPNDSTYTYELRIVDKTVLFGYNIRNKTYKYIDQPAIKLLINYHKNAAPDHVVPFNVTKAMAALPFINGAFGYRAKSDTYYFSEDSLIVWVHNDSMSSKRLGGSIINIVTDRNDDVWVCFHKRGVAFYKDGDFNREPITFLQHVSVDDVEVDHEGGIWIATLEKGVYYVPSSSILVYQNVPYLNDHIVYIGEFKDKVLVSTYGHSISEVTDFRFKQVDYLCKIAESRSTLLFTTKIHDTAYASFSGELVRFAPQKLPQKNKFFQSDYAAAKFILETTDHYIWLLNGAGIRNINNQTCTSISYVSPFKLTCGLVKGTDLLVAGKKGLYLFKNRKYESLGDLDPLLKSQITAMTEDKTGAIWIATMGKGVLRLKNNKVIHIPDKKGMISNICTSITMDDYNNIWIGTNKGLSCIQNIYAEDEKWQIKNIDDKNGLNSNDVTTLFADKEVLWVGTMWGLSCLQIKNCLLPIPASRAYISDIAVNGTMVSKHVFSYKENNLKFKLDALTFKDQGDHLFRYRLIGLDSSWTETKTDELLINNLAPGNYLLQVQVANKDKIWSSNTADYSFIIHKPFWLTWWFILLEIVMLILIVYLIILWRTNIIKRKEEEKLRINKLLSEYQMKALTAQMNPHFIFNAINSIQNFIIQNHSTLAYDYLIKFSKLIRLVLNNSKDNEITVQQELDTLALYIELEQLRFEKSFDYYLTVDPKLDTQSLTIPALLLQPYIENAIWHGLMPLKTRKGEIGLTIVEESGLLKIIITDNGVGRKASDQIKKKIVHKNHQSVGMELTGKRIELFGQESTFSLQLTDNYDELGNATGTTVEIILPMMEMY